MTAAWVWGVGSSQFGKQPEATAAELAWEAVIEAVRDADGDSIDAVYAGSCFGEPGIAQRVLHALGIVKVPIIAMENACASSTTAFHEAVAAVQSGRYGTVLALGVDHLTSRFAGALPVEARDVEGRTGLALPALYAMSATRYMQEYGLTSEQLAAVSVKNHAHGTGNPRAQHGKAVSMADVLGSRLIADPLTLLQCCAIADGAAAAVIGDRRRGSRDIAVLGTAFQTGGLWGADSPHVWGYDLIRDTAQATYDAAGVGLADVDLIELHDAFTIGEIVTLEALGVAEYGHGGHLAPEGTTALGGSLPVNPSGGLLSRGHPLGATGMAQVAEAVWQLRGDAGQRQVDGASVALIETMGGGVGGIDGNACVIGILANEAA